MLKSLQRIDARLNRMLCASEGATPTAHIKEKATGLIKKYGLTHILTIQSQNIVWYAVHTWNISIAFHSSANSYAANVCDEVGIEKYTDVDNDIDTLISDLDTALNDIIK